MGRATFRGSFAAEGMPQADIDMPGWPTRAVPPGLAPSADLQAAYFSDSAETLVNTRALSAAYQMQRPAAPTSIAAARHRQIACDTSEFEAISAMARQVTHYEDQILHLKAASATAIEQRDKWKQRAQEAEARLASGATPVSSAANSQYVALKRRLARMLHPDSPQASAESKSEREAIFVEIWTAIEQLEKLPDANC